MPVTSARTITGQSIHLGVTRIPTPNQLVGRLRNRAPRLRFPCGQLKALVRHRMFAGIGRTGTRHISRFTGAGATAGLTTTIPTPVTDGNGTLRTKRLGSKSVTATEHRATITTVPAHRALHRTCGATGVTRTMTPKQLVAFRTSPCGVSPASGSTPAATIKPRSLSTGAPQTTLAESVRRQLTLGNS